jgi:aryl-alcohol dehydrogenase-like predicted oxidoreductase
MREETYGLSETYIGNWLAKRKKRDDVVIATKVAGPFGAPQPNMPPPMQWIRGGQTRLDAKNIKNALDDSLRRLQTDYVDLYQLHWPDRNTNYFGTLNYRHNDEELMTPLKETLSALQAAVQAGKVRYIGLSNETPWGVAECLRLAREAGLPRVVSVQNPYNLLNRTYEIGMAEISAREQCGLLPYSPLAFGVLSGKYLDSQRPSGARLTLFTNYNRYISDVGIAATEDLVALARRHNVDAAQMAIAFTIQQPFVTSSIIGATTLAQLKSNIAAADLTLDDVWMKELNELCEKHCNPCP